LKKTLSKTSTLKDNVYTNITFFNNPIKTKTKMIYISVCIIIKKNLEKKILFHGFSSKFLLKIFAFGFPIFDFGNLR